MKISFEITRSDYADFITRYFIRKRLTKTIIYSICGLIGILYFVNRGNKSVSLKYNVIAFVVFIVVYAGQIIYRLRRTGNIPLENGSILGLKDVEIDDFGLKCNDHNSNTTISWNAIREIDETSKAIYLFLDNNMGLIIPKRALMNEDDIYVLKDLLNKNIKVA